MILTYYYNLDEAGNTDADENDDKSAADEINGDNKTKHVNPQKTAIDAKRSVGRPKK